MSSTHEQQLGTQDCEVLNKIDPVVSFNSYGVPSISYSRNLLRPVTIDKHFFKVLHREHFVHAASEF